MSGFRCTVCGCTDNAACLTPDGFCSWVAPNLCSACVTSSRAVDVVAGDFAEDLRPAPAEPPGGEQ